MFLYAVGVAHNRLMQTPHPPNLLIKTGGGHYTVAPDEAPVTVGREFPAQVTIEDPRISRLHLRVEVAAGNWVGVDLSRNGVYLSGARQASFPITDGLTARLGNPDGIPVTFALASGNAAAPLSDDGDDEDTTKGDASAAIDPNIARAGAAVADRRTELDLSRRLLARDGVINAGTLTSLERGTHWPKASTLRKLEEVLGWEPGTITRLRMDKAPTAEAAEVTVALTGSIAAAHMAEASMLAMEAIRARIALLPDPAEPTYDETASVILDELRRLERLTARVARDTVGAPQVTATLAAIRTTYRELMLTAAAGPHATLGQRLFAARHRGGLSEEEAAAATGITAELISNAEAGQPISAANIAAIKLLLAALG
jgi:transcriptional regulator with XRE-family HTH domain